MQNAFEKAQSSRGRATLEGTKYNSPVFGKYKQALVMNPSFPTLSAAVINKVCKRTTTNQDNISDAHEAQTIAVLQKECPEIQRLIQSERALAHIHRCRRETQQPQSTRDKYRQLDKEQQQQLLDKYNTRPNKRYTSKEYRIEVVQLFPNTTLTERDIQTIFQRFARHHEYIRNKPNQVNTTNM